MEADGDEPSDLLILRSNLYRESESGISASQVVTNPSYLFEIGEISDPTPGSRVRRLVDSIAWADMVVIPILYTVRVSLWWKSPAGATGVIVQDRGHLVGGVVRQSQASKYQIHVFFDYPWQLWARTSATDWWDQ